MNFTLPKRFALLKAFSFTYLSLSFLIRIILFVMAIKEIDFSLVNTIEVFALGLFFDIGSLSYILAISLVYLLLVPSKFHGSRFDRIATNFAYILVLLVLIFSFLAEITFWDEYQRRFNFIAIDYLLYTWEVVQNIHESYPLPYLITVLIAITSLIIIYTKRRNYFTDYYQSDTQFKHKLIPVLIGFSVVAIFHVYIKNTQAERFANVNENELAKSGLYSFFAAYQSNELNYDEFYQTIPKDKLHLKLPLLITADGDSLLGDEGTIRRLIRNSGSELRPNIIFVGMESMSASYLAHYGNDENLTPALDSIMSKSIAFTNLFATGTRTIRGLEAFSLSVPPTPGRSIVKRTNNSNLFTIAEVFKQKGYSSTFFCGGDALFDNMANYFGNNGFDVVDRKKEFRTQPTIVGKRIQIKDEQITFENAWGACDGDIYNVVLAKADQDAQSQKPFFYLFMTNSNHAPFTYPDGVVDIPSGKSREGAIRYADVTFGQFIEKAKTKPWFKNTIFVVASDHCAASAGKSEINVSRHLIPAFIYNLPSQAPQQITKLASQIDIMPTVFGYLNWSYETNLYGLDISKMRPADERALIANHRKVCLLKKDTLLILETQKKQESFIWNRDSNELSPIKTDSTMLVQAITYYQSAFELFKNNGLKK